MAKTPTKTRKNAPPSSDGPNGGSTKDIQPKEHVSEQRCAFTGSKIDYFSKVLFKQVQCGIWAGNSSKDEALDQFSAAAGALMGIAPKDELEGMLAVQMVSIHNATMECLRRAMIPEQCFDGRTGNLNQANKLARTFTTQMEALNRYRGKGQQKMTVEHVHVHEGGQAIVGNVQGGRGGEKNEGQPDAKAADA